MALATIVSTDNTVLKDSSQNPKQGFIRKLAPNLTEIWDKYKVDREDAKARFPYDPSSSLWVLRKKMSADMRQRILFNLHLVSNPVSYYYDSEFPIRIPRMLAKSGKPMIVAIGGCSNDAEFVATGSNFFRTVFEKVIKANRQIEMGSGGTTDGVPGFCWEVKAQHENEVFLLGWRMEGRRIETGDHRYDMTLIMNSPIDTWAREVYSYIDMLGKVKHLNPGKKIIFLMYNGGDTTLTEALGAIREGYPLVIVNGSGREADELASNQVIRSEKNVHVLPFDPEAVANKINELVK